MRLLIVDDDPIVCQSLATILAAQADIEVVGTGTDGDAAVALFARTLPDAALVDIQMLGRDGLSAAEEILAARPDARIVFLSTFSDDDYIVRALRMGARGYLIKQDVAAIAPALRAVCAGQCVLEGEVLERAALLGAGSAGARAGAGGEVSRAPDERALAGLTEREREVVRAVADGLDNAEVARALGIGEGTVRNHISAILAKLGLRNRTQIAIHYYRHCR